MQTRKERQALPVPEKPKIEQKSSSASKLKVQKVVEKTDETPDLDDQSEEPKKLEEPNTAPPMQLLPKEQLNKECEELVKTINIRRRELKALKKDLLKA